MLSVIIKNTNEPNVVRLTYDNFCRDLLSVKDSTELIVADTWETGYAQSKGNFVSFVEPDCLVSSGFYSSNFSLFKKNDHYRKLAMVGSSVGVDDWGNRIYNYKLGQVTAGDDDLSVTYWRLQPERRKKGQGLYPVQVSFFPGAIFRRTAIDDIVREIGLKDDDLVRLSTKICFYLWGNNRRLLINPNTTYVTTDRRVENPGLWEPEVPDQATAIFAREQL